VPDLEQRTAEIALSPDRLGYFLGIGLLVGEGNNQYVDDMFSSPDGRLLYVSRPSLADVAAFDLKTHKIVWRVPIEGYRSDHMAISPDGRRLLVSASTARKVHVIDTAAGKIVGEFESGDQPHENNYSHDGKLIYHASIGTVYTPADDPALDASKGDRWFQIVDAGTLKVIRRIDVGQKLAEAGFPNMSSAVRPMALSPDERYVYMQLSFLHGFVEYDLQQDRPLRIANLPLSEKAKAMRREQYVLDSAHHGLTMNPAGTKLCVAGTMSDYAAIVSRETFAYDTVHVGDKPYWATNNGDGRYCFVSVSGEDRVAVISYATANEVASIPVGDHPQRMRMGTLATDVPDADTVPPRMRRLRVIWTRPGRRALRMRMSERARLTIRVRKVGRRGRLRNVRVMRRSVRAGANRVRLGRLRGKGRYRVVVRARDAAGNSSARRVLRFGVKPRR
jgi:DNA-binding beta-propeller fold protein YncE